MSVVHFGSCKCFQITDIQLTNNVLITKVLHQIPQRYRQRPQTQPQAETLGRAAQSGTQKHPLQSDPHRFFGSQLRLPGGESIEDFFRRGLAQALHQRLRAQAERVDRAELRLGLLDPRLVLQRGYALLTDSDGRTVTGVGQARPGDALRATLADGVLDLTVGQPRLL